MFKKRQLEKVKFRQNFKQCDQISEEILDVRREKKSVEHQLTALDNVREKKKPNLNGTSTLINPRRRLQKRKKFATTSPSCL